MTQQSSEHSVYYVVKLVFKLVLPIAHRYSLLGASKRQRQDRYMSDLEGELKEQVVSLCEKGVELQDEERFHASNKEFLEVYTLLPEPKANWKAYTWLISSIADNHFELNEYQPAYDKLNEVVSLDQTATDNAYICLRRGQCALELGDEQTAQTLLKQAFEIEGKELFEDEHSKFLKLAKQ